MGLEKYGSYLVDQLEFASKSESRAAYKRYVEKELDMNKKKITSIEAKSKSSFFFNTRKPLYSMYLMKHYFLPWFYWNMIMKGRDLPL